VEVFLHNKSKWENDGSKPKDQHDPNLLRLGLRRYAETVLHYKGENDGSKPKDQHDPNFSRLRYIRYADDLILGFTGSRENAEVIFNSIKDFVETNLKLTVNEEKSKIYHSSDRNIKFLGFFLRYLPPKRTLDQDKADKGIKQVKMVAINSAQLRIPVETILKRLKNKGYASIRENGTYRATSCRRLGSLEDKLIVRHYSSVIRGLQDYYQPANQFSDM
jgi:hypothetical protein